MEILTTDWNGDGIDDAFAGATNQTVVKIGILNSLNNTALADAEFSDLIIRLEQKLGELMTEVDGISTTGILDYTPLSVVDGFISPARPELEVIDATFPSAPDANLSIGTVAGLVIDDVPILSAVEPVINTIVAPTKFTKAAPVATPLTDRAFPDKPGYALPTAPTARILTLPTAPNLINIEFAGVLPTALAAPPNVEFSFTEQEYQSILNNELKAKLLNLVLNVAQTGLNPAIEQQIWDRSRERTRATTQGVIDNINRMYARAGWSLPQGDQIKSIYKAQEQQSVADITESRSIAIAQADLEQKNFQFAFTQALALEGQLLNLHNSAQQRAFDSAKYAVEALINLYQIQATYFNAGVTLYTAQAQVYRDRIQGELSKLEVYKTELEGQKLIGELNAQDVANYTAQIQAVVAVFGLYKDELEAVKIQLEGDGLKVQQFEANIRAFSEEIKAKGLEYDGYKAEQSGEEIKANMYNALVGAFGKRIDAFTSVNDAKVKKLDADIKVNIDVPLKIFEQQNINYKTQVEAIAARLDGLSSLNKVNSEIYKTDVEAESSKIGAQVSVQKQESDLEIKKREMYTEALKANIATFLAQKEMFLGTLKTMAQMKAQLVSAFGSNVNYSAGLSDTRGYSVSQGTSYTQSRNSSYPHAESPSTE